MGSAVSILVLEKKKACVTNLNVPLLIECVLYVIYQTYLLAMYCTSQPSHEENQLNLSAAQYVTF